jgi:large subunit ribosomal protein L1
MKKTKNVKTKKVVDFSNIYDNLKTYRPAEAISILKKISHTKFDPSVEVHIRLGINPKKSDQQVRGAVSLPHGTGKTIRIAAFVSPENEEACKKAGADLVGSDELIAQIKKTEKTDFEVAVAEPLMMKNLAVIAKILGTRGLMPSPKNDTVSPTPAKAIEELKKGKISFKNDDTSNLHTVIGKLSFEDEKLLANFQALIDVIRKIKPSSAKGTYLKSVVICSSMSPSVKVEL